MMATAVQEKTTSSSSSSPVENKLSKIPPSVLLIGKKRALDYIAPALFRINNTSELVIRATGSLSIVTAVDVAEMVKRDVENLAIKSITIGTDELIIATGERKRMSCIEIHLIKVNPMMTTTSSTTTTAATTTATSPLSAMINDIAAAAPIIAKETTAEIGGEDLVEADAIATNTNTNTDSIVVYDTKEKGEKKSTTRTRKKSTSSSSTTTTAAAKKKKATVASKKKSPVA